MHTQSINDYSTLLKVEMMASLIAVETSDIVNSTSMSQEQLSQCMSALKQCLASIHKEHNIVYEFYRGDAFQIMYPNALLSLRHLLLLKLYMRSHLPFSVDITQSLAVGIIDRTVTSLHDRMDSVFVNSGRQLESVNKAEIGIYDEGFTQASHLALAFFNRILTGISAKQALVLYWYIKCDFPEHKKIASQLNMTRQNVNTHLLRANADLIKGFILYFEKTIGEHTL